MWQRLNDWLRYDRLRDAERDIEELQLAVLGLQNDIKVLRQEGWI